MSPLIARHLLALSHPDDAVRQAAVDGLAEVEVTALLSLACDESDSFHAAAMTALDELAARGHGQLIWALHSLEPGMRGAAIWLRLDRGPIIRAFSSDRALPQLVAALCSAEMWRRASVARALLEILPTRESAPQMPTDLLEALLLAPETVRLAVTLLLGFQEADDAELLLRAQMDDTSAAVRRAAARILGMRGELQAVPVLVASLARDEMAGRVEAAEALRDIAQQHPTPGLRAALPILRRLRWRGRVFAEALERIEAATDALQDLPLRATSPAPDASSLPIPSRKRP